MRPLTAGDPRAVGEFRLRARLGAGGMGRVYLGFSPSGRAVAVKVVRRELAWDHGFRTRFGQEVAAARAVSGIYTAPVVAAGLDDDPPWLATAFVPGPSLDGAVEAAGPLPDSALWKLAAGLVEALQAIHAAQLVHRDLKPANVLLAVDGPRVIDFGISRALDGTSMTATGMVIGTPAFMSPEQATAAPTGPSSDVFSLGCLLAFAATGVPPFGDGNPATVLYQIVHSPPALDLVPKGLRGFVASCLAKRPGGRPALAALADTIATAMRPDVPASLASFWPAAITDMIADYQARLGAEMAAAEDLQPMPVAGPAGGAPAALAAQSGGASAGLGLAGGGAPGAPASPRPSRTGRHAAAGPGAGGGRASGRPVTGHTDPLGGRRLIPGLRAALAGPDPDRRRILLAVAGTCAAGLGVLGWELSDDGTRRGVADGTRPRPATGRKAAPRAAASAGKPPSPGTVLWTFPTGDHVEADPTAAGGVIYAGSEDHNVYAIRASDGAKLWTYYTGARVYSGPAVLDGVVYVGSNDHNLYALRASDGAKLWNYVAGESITGDPKVAGGVVYAGCDDQNVYAIDAASGDRIWAKFTGAPVFAKPAVARGVVYVGSADFHVYALRASDGAEVWNYFTNGPVFEGPVLAGGVAYFGSGDHNVYALRARDGRRLWSFRTGNQVNAAPAVTGGVVYIASTDHNVYALRASDGAELWRYRTGSKVYSGPVVAGGVVYAGSTDHNVYALRASDGARLWSYDTGAAVYPRPAVANNAVYAGSDDNYVYALQA
jgi:outer membrane protein assembly factor BamB